MVRVDFVAVDNMVYVGSQQGQKTWKKTWHVLICVVNSNNKQVRNGL